MTIAACKAVIGFSVCTVTSFIFRIKRLTYVNLNCFGHFCVIVMIYLHKSFAFIITVNSLCVLVGNVKLLFDLNNT